MSRPLKRGILGASTTILSKNIDKYAFMCGSNFYETDVNYLKIYSCVLNFIYLSFLGKERREKGKENRRKG